jgi:cell division protease FtsH
VDRDLAADLANLVNEATRVATRRGAEKVTLPDFHAALERIVADPVHKISNVPRGLGALGYTMERPSEGRYLLTQAQLDARPAVLMGGRAAEAMVARYGMLPALGAVSYDGGQERMLGLPGAQREHTPETSREVDLAVREILDRAA